MDRRSRRREMDDRRSPGHRPPARRHADNSAYPAINVDIQHDARDCRPDEAASARDDHVRRRRAARACPSPRRAGGRVPCSAAPPPRGATVHAPTGDPPATEQLIAAGWGYASLSPTEHPGRQRRRPHARHHRAGQQRRSRASRTTGARCAPGPGARRAASTISKPTRRRRREARRHRRRFALRQGRAGRDGVRSRGSPSCSSAPRAKAARSCIAATGAKRSRTSPARASTTGWPATS